MIHSNTGRVRQGFCVLLALGAFSSAVDAACLGAQGGDLATMEELAFRNPTAALPQLASAISAATDMPPTQRAALHAIAADASRQLGFSRQTITHSETGLALLPAGDMSDLAIRMRTVRALVSTNIGGIDAATVELTRLIDAVGEDRPLALGCLLRDRGWLNFRDGNPDQALDDLMNAYKLLQRNASREETMVAAGRLSMAQFSVRDYPQALAIWDRLGPMARMMWSPPLRDYRPRLKEALVMLGVLRSAAVRPPLMPISDDERGTIRGLLVHAGLLSA